MKKIPVPIFQNKLPGISWVKIYTREYGVQYSEMAIRCLSPEAGYHIPHPSVEQIIIPEGKSTAFYIDSNSWNTLVISLNTTYTTDSLQLKKYESQFVKDGEDYLKLSKKLSKLNLSTLSNSKLASLYCEYQKKLFRYSVYAWTSFILNNYVSERAEKILDKYLTDKKLQGKKQEIIESLFKPEEKAAVFRLQEEIEKFGDKRTGRDFEKIYEKYKWLSCLDLHNNPWTKIEFKEHISSLKFSSHRKIVAFEEYANRLNIKGTDLEYLKIAKRFVYVKDARDDYRRQGVFFARSFFNEIALRMNLSINELSLLQETEILSFLVKNNKIDNKIINRRKKGFILYLNNKNQLVCLSGEDLSPVLTSFRIVMKDGKPANIRGAVASKGTAKGKVVIVKGIKDLQKVKTGDVLVAVSTHPDYVPAMKRAVAIVTDEGGITCHAAIVSREFGIPCIVGTGNATSRLMNGNIVEVDAIEGIIRIIS